MSQEQATRALLEQMAEHYGCTIKEEHQTVFYKSLRQSFNETFLMVMKGEHPCFEVGLYMLENWIQPAHIERLFEQRVPKDVS